MKAMRASLPRRDSGMTLIEVLVAVLILSIGLLGLAGLQTVSLRSNHSAYLRSQATVLTYDIADRMRANRRSALERAYNTDFSDGPPPSGTVVNDDLAAWKNALSNILPSGLGSIAVDGGTATIVVRWHDSRAAEAEPVFFEMQTRL